MVRDEWRNRGEFWSSEPVEAGKGFVISRSDLLAPGNELRQALALATAKGALEISHAVVVAEFLHFVIPRASFG